MVDIASVRAEASRRVAARARLRPLMEALHPKQRTFVADPARRKAGLCTRRAGKSHGVAVWLLEGAALSLPETLSPYIATTRGHARRILWATLRQLNAQWQLGLDFHESDLTVDWPGGGRVWVTGCPDTSHAEVYRGPAYRRVAIDEAGSFPAYIRTLVSDILDPALMDWDGELALIGSPGISPDGLFYDATAASDTSWSVHTWSVLDNPYVREPAAYLERVLRDNKWSADHPTYVREYLGRWVEDSSMRVYHIPHNALAFDVPRTDGWHYVLSIDIGSSEYHPTTAFSLLAYHPRELAAYVVRSWCEAGMTPSSIAERIKEIMSAYSIESIVMDPGGLGGAYVKEMNERHALPVEPAEKASKRAYQEMLNGDLKTGRLKLIERDTAGLREEAKVLAWKTPAKLEEGEQPNHECDAMLYGWRRCRQYLSVAPVEKDPSRCEEEDRIVQEMVRAERAKHQRHSYARRR